MIRIANNLDIETIANFQITMAKETEDYDLKPANIQPGVTHIIDHPHKGFYLVYEEKKQVIASALALKEWSDWRNAEILWIHSVYVLPEHRGKGVFKEIYEYLKSMVEKQSDLCGLRLYVDKTNLAAQKVYQKVGMNKDHYHLYEWMQY